MAKTIEYIGEKYKVGAKTLQDYQAEGTQGSLITMGDFDPRHNYKEYDIFLDPKTGLVVEDEHWKMSSGFQVPGWLAMTGWIAGGALVLYELADEIKIFLSHQAP